MAPSFLPPSTVLLPINSVSAALTSVPVPNSLALPGKEEDDSSCSCNSSLACVQLFLHACVGHGCCDPALFHCGVRGVLRLPRGAELALAGPTGQAPCVVFLGFMA